jgi:signal transduction histidine kinase
LNEIFQSVQSIIIPSLTKNGIDITLPQNINFLLKGNQNEFLQVLVNIIKNAQDAILLNNIKNGNITVSVHKEGGNIVISIVDNAGGIHDDHIDKIFDPYFTTKHKSQGTGIGLYMSKQIIEKYGNARIYASNTEEGANFTIEVCTL